MIKCEAIQMFTLERYGELENLKRKNTNKEKQIYKGDTFECSVELAKYLYNNKVVKILEVMPSKK